MLLVLQFRDLGLEEAVEVRRNVSRGTLSQNLNGREGIDILK